MYRLDTKDRLHLRNAARDASKLEREWQSLLVDSIHSNDEWVFRALWDHGRFAEGSVDFLPILIDHAYRSTELGIRDAKSHEPSMSPTKLAAERFPKTLKRLKELYDAWRKGQEIPKSIRKDAEHLKKAYIRRCHSVWEKHGKSFRDGGVYNRSAVTRVLERDGDMATSRAKTIVQTETTRYYNGGRRRIYDASEDVTHYLFVAIRDQATTKWCRTRQGVVYEKGSAYLERETPPCHWNCRSEILPLSPLNPRHLRLIKDPSLQRANRRPAPLPPGWNS